MAKDAIRSNGEVGRPLACRSLQRRPPLSRGQNFRAEPREVHPCRAPRASELHSGAGKQLRGLGVGMIGGRWQVYGKTGGKHSHSHLSWVFDTFLPWLLETE